MIGTAVTTKTIGSSLVFFICVLQDRSTFHGVIAAKVNSKFSRLDDFWGSFVETLFSAK